jgi:3-oxoadipate enol-lactonase
MLEREALADELQVFAHNGCPIHYRLLGPADAPLIVLTHGGMVDHRVWNPQAPVLSKEYRLLLWDVRGHGQSRPGGNQRSIHDLTDDLVALLDHLGYREAVLVGLSAGGLLVQEFAYRYPDRVVGLVVAAQICWTDLPFKSRIVFGRGPALIIALLTLLVPWKLYLRLMMRQGAAHSKPRTRGYLQDVFGGWTKLEFVRHIRSSTGGLRHDPGHRFRQPLLITHGDHEMDWVRTDAAAWAEREPQARYEVIPDAGHVVNMDNPDAFNALLLEFLAELRNEVECKERPGAGAGSRSVTSP